MYKHTTLSRVCIHTCKNNKANLIKGVGGEAARQKDINSLSESNNRGGGGVGGRETRIREEGGEERGRVQEGEKDIEKEL